MTDWCKISEETLSAFLDGELPRRQQRQLACHIVDCPVCSRRVGSLYALKNYVGYAEQVATSVPAGLWTHIREALDTVDRVARSLPHLGPRSVPAWRLPALVAVGVVLIVSALYTRQLLVTRPGTVDSLFQAHYSAVAQLLPTHVGMGRYEAISTGSQRKTWQPIRMGVVRISGALGKQQVYRMGWAALSYFSLPDRALQPDSMVVVQQNQELFYLGTSAQLSMVAWRQPDGWGILVADMYPEQLLPLAEAHAHTPHLSTGF